MSDADRMRWNREWERFAEMFQNNRAALASGCCSASTPCDHQKVSPSTICDACQKAADPLDRPDWDGGGPYRVISAEEYRRLKASGEKVAWAEGCGYVAYDEQADREFRAALSPAPPAASGWREEASFRIANAMASAEHMIWKRDEWAKAVADHDPRDADRYPGVSKPLAAADAVAALAAAPPPPVPAQAESGEVRDLEFLAGCQKSATGEETSNSVALKRAADRIRKLEGEVARITALHNIELERNCNRDAPRDG